MPEAIAVLAIERDTPRKIVADWQIDCALQVDIVVISVLGLCVAAISAVQHRIIFGDEHRAAGCVSAGERALRAA